MLNLKLPLYFNAWVELVAGIILFLTPSLFFSGADLSLLTSLYGIGAATIGLISYGMYRNFDSLTEGLKTYVGKIFGIFHVLLAFQCIRFYKIDFLANMLNDMIWLAAIALHLVLALGFGYVSYKKATTN